MELRIFMVTVLFELMSIGESKTIFVALMGLVAGYLFGGECDHEHHVCDRHGGTRELEHAELFARRSYRHAPLLKPWPHRLGGILGILISCLQLPTVLDRIMETFAPSVRILPPFHERNDPGSRLLVLAGFWHSGSHGSDFWDLSRPQGRRK